MNKDKTVTALADMLETEGLFGSDTYVKEIKETFIKCVHDNNYCSEWNERGVKIRVQIDLIDEKIITIEDSSVGNEKCEWDKDKIRYVESKINILLDMLV